MTSESAGDFYSGEQQRGTLRLVRSQNSQPATEAFSRPVEHISLEKLIGPAASAVFKAFEDLGDRQALTQLRVSSRVRQILDAIAADPVEPGVTHPAEPLLHAGPWLAIAPTLVEAFQEHSTARRSLLLLIGRLDQSDYGSPIRSLIERGLQDEDEFVREAAVRATETLGSEAKELLRRHSDANPWIAKYVQRLLA